jgi:hypothetical protein
MSYIKEINEKINNTVSNFIYLVAEKYSLDYDELYAEWNSTGSISTKSDSNIKKSISKDYEKTKTVKLNISNAELSLQTVDILKGMCKDRGLKCGGKKSELIERLKACENVKMVDNSLDENEKNVKVQTNKSKVVPDIFKKIEKSNFAIRRNDFGNYEHEETSFLFNDDKRVYGVQLKDGNIRNINKEDIDICNKYKFPYIIPENLNNNEEDIDILEEDEELEVDEVEVEEEIEEINEEDILQSEEEYEEVDEEEV